MLVGVSGGKAGGGSRLACETNTHSGVTKGGENLGVAAGQGDQGGHGEKPQGSHLDGYDEYKKKIEPKF